MIYAATRWTRRVNGNAAVSYYLYSAATLDKKKKKKSNSAVKKRCYCNCTFVCAVLLILIISGNINTFVNMLQKSYKSLTAQF